jgi:hypothetical protein
VIYTENGRMVPIVPWGDYVEKIPTVAVIGLVNEWMTIYACCQQALKNFDQIIVCGDGVSPDAKLMLDKFLSDYSSECKGRFHFIDLGDVDPWPWVSMARPGVEYEDITKIPVKSWSKAGFKRFNYARAIFPNSILCSLHSDVIVFNDTGKRIKERMSQIRDPFFDSEWYSMVTMHDKHNIESILSPDSSPGNHKKHPALRQRTTYDYPGDWGLMSIYASSMLSVGPDPGGHEAECLYPWSRVTQCEKKGCDTSVPHAIHLEWIRDSCLNRSFAQTSWKIVSREWVKKNDQDLGKRLSVIDEVFFPVKFGLDENKTLRIEK